MVCTVKNYAADVKKIVWEKIHIGMRYKGVTQRCFIEKQMMVYPQKISLFNYHTFFQKLPGKALLSTPI